MIQRTSPSTLFPYTTLFRSSSVLKGSRIGLKATAEVQRMRVSVRALEEAIGSAVMYVDNAKYYTFATDTSGKDRKSTRLNSSHANLVCRLLLEKKKNNHSRR